MTDLPGDEQSRLDAVRAREERNELAASFLERPKVTGISEGGTLAGEQRSLFQDARDRFVRNKLAMAGSVIMLVFLILAIFVPWHFTGNFLYSPENVSKGSFFSNPSNMPISMKHPFGTNDQGQDLWKLVWVGARISLSIAIAVALSILVIGVLYGSISGYVGGRTDNLMMRFLDSLYGLPYLPFAIILASILRPRFPDHPLIYVVPALSLTTWFGQARLMRSQVLTLKENDYVESAKSQGANSRRTIFRHILPNTIGITVVAIALELPGAILGEAFLSFLGLGVQPPNTSWGRLASTGADYFSVNPKLVWIPGLMIATSVLCFIAISDGLRDALDPRYDR